MPSASLTRWQRTRAAELDELETAHRAVGGTGPGRRHGTQQVNQAYAVLLVSHFQGFCRDLHTEVVDFLLGMAHPEAWRPGLRIALTANRALDRGNPHSRAIADDFNRLGVALWDVIDAMDRRNPQRRRRLDELVRWRNAVAHQDFDPERLGGRTTLTLRMVRSWRSACDALARSFDRAMEAHAAKIAGAAPW